MPRRNNSGASSHIPVVSEPSSTGTGGRKRRGDSGDKGNKASVKKCKPDNNFDPQLAGVAVRPHVRRAGPYLIGPRLGTSPVKSIAQCLARKVEGGDEDKFYLIKMLTLSGEDEEASQDEKHGKMLLHTEHSLLSLLEGEPGVIRKYDFFTELCYQEVEREDRQLYYSGRKTKRICLVLDCLVPNDFQCSQQKFMNLQHFVIKQQLLPEKLALVIFYNVVKVVAALHERNVVHRDLKLGNIVLHKSSKKVTVTNFCLGKYLMSDDDLLRDQRGSPAYISPDVLSGNPYQGKPSDMWALGVVLYTMLYGQFPFYDVVPSELFNRIKAAEFAVPEDGRVSEDTKGIIRRLLVIDPAKRLTAKQLQAAVERVIAVWRAVAPKSSANLQLVPEIKGPESKDDPSSVPPQQQPPVAFNAPRTDLLLNLFHLHSSPRGGGGNEDKEEEKLAADGAPNVHGRFRATRTLDDARPLSADEYRAYGPIIGRMRQNNPSNISSTGQPLDPPQTETPLTSASTPTHVLLSHRSPLLSTLRQLAIQQESLQPPVPAAPSDAAVPVIEQDLILDLSNRNFSLIGEGNVSQQQLQRRRVLPAAIRPTFEEVSASFPAPSPAHANILAHHHRFDNNRQPQEPPPATHEPRQYQPQVHEALPLMLQQPEQHHPPAHAQQQQRSDEQQLVPQQPPETEEARQSVLPQQQLRLRRRDQQVVPEQFQSPQVLDPAAVIQCHSAVGTRLSLAQQVTFGGRLLLHEQQQYGPPQQQPHNLSHQQGNAASGSNVRQEVRQVRPQLEQSPRRSSRREPSAVELREALMRMQVSRNSSEVNPSPPQQSVSLREALLRMNPEAVLRSDEIVARSNSGQRPRSREFR